MGCTSATFKKESAVRRNQFEFLGAPGPWAAPLFLTIICRNLPQTCPNSVSQAAAPAAASQIQSIQQPSSTLPLSRFQLHNLIFHYELFYFIDRPPKKFAYSYNNYYVQYTVALLWIISAASTIVDASIRIPTSLPLYLR